MVCGPCCSICTCNPCKCIMSHVCCSVCCSVLRACYSVLRAVDSFAASPFVAWLVHRCDMTPAHASCHILERVMHMSNVTHMNESCHTYTQHMYYPVSDVSHMNESCHTYIVQICIHMHLTHTNESSQTYTLRVYYVHGSCDLYKRDVAHIYTTLELSWDDSQVVKQKQK